jgi:pectate lyase
MMPFSKARLVLLASALLNLNVFTANAVPAFPGAEGAGANAIGGRGGDVYFVTNTNNTGTGSLRNGIANATGPRTIVFRVSGNIDLTSDLSINKPYLTIAGQTAPGDGITLRRRNTRISATHNVIVRYLRFRPGDLDSTFENDAFSVVNGTNVMIDHVSSSWSVDECLSVTHSTNITVQWSMISESLKNSQHAKGSHGYASLLRYGPGALTFHHNLYQHHDSRNPRLGDNIKVDFVNNVIYNWGGRAGYSGDYGTDIQDNPNGFTNYLNYVRNYLVAGPSTGPSSEAFRGGTTNTVIYQLGNLIDANKNLQLDGADTGWNMFTILYTQSASPYPLPAVATNSARDALQRVLAFSGASATRDSVDTRLIGTVRNQNGRLIDAVGSGTQSSDYVTNNINGTNYVFVRGWPVLNSTTSPPDSDDDGIANYFETALGWNPNVTNHNHLNADGYTDLEWYLNWLAAPRAVTAMNQPVAVNLRTLTGNDPDLIFSVTPATNGTVTLNPDGFTAQFTPSAQFMGLVDFQFQATNPVAGAGLGSVAVTVLVTNVAPAIVVSPTNQAVNPGGTAVFSVQASGGGLSYQWRRNGGNLTNSGTLSGATTATLTVSNVTTNGAGSYTVVVTNALGSVTSGAALLTVAANSAPTLSPISDYNLIAGATLTFTNAASDPDVGQDMSFTLLNAPNGAVVGLNDGVFQWRPVIAQGGANYDLSVVVADTGSPILTATQTFNVTVTPPVAPQIEILAAGIPLQLQIAGDSGPDYILQGSTNLTDWSPVSVTNSPAMPFLWTMPPDPAAWDWQFYRILLGP